MLERLRAASSTCCDDVAEDVQLQMERPTIFVLYEQNIGLLTPMIADELRDAEKHFPADWIADAFREAVTTNKRSWKYVLRHPRTLAGAGQGPGAASRVEERRPASAYYVPEGYEDLIEH